jgi:hypothetical protein
MHGYKSILDSEYKTWYACYSEGQRHLFIEYPYYAAEFMNLWIKSDSDELLDELFDAQAGTAGNSEYNYAFYKKIKEELPETVFHGTDIGHQYGTTGLRYLQYLEDKGLADSEQYTLAQECIEQGKRFYASGTTDEEMDWAERENAMAANFIREYDKLGGIKILGIYGSAHTDYTINNYLTKTVGSMAKQLRAHYGDIVSFTTLSPNYNEHAGDGALPLPGDERPPEYEAVTDRSGEGRIDTLTIGGKDYEATYFGIQDLREFLEGQYLSREFWRVENAYDDFKNYKAEAENYLPYNRYPMDIELKQVFALRYVLADGTERTEYHRSDGLTGYANADDPITRTWTTEFLTE